jgi:hypothetical protein
MEEIIQSYHYKMDKLSKIQKGGTSDTYNGRKQEDRRTELRKLGEALQHLQNKRCRFELLHIRYQKVFYVTIFSS